MRPFKRRGCTHCTTIGAVRRCGAPRAACERPPAQMVAGGAASRVLLNATRRRHALAHGRAPAPPGSATPVSMRIPASCGGTLRVRASPAPRPPRAAVPRHAGGYPVGQSAPRRRPRPSGPDSRVRAHQGRGQPPRTAGDQTGRSAMLRPESRGSQSAATSRRRGTSIRGIELEDGTPCNESLSAKWHATKCSSPISRNGGRSTLQISSA